MRAIIVAYKNLPLRWKILLPFGGLSLAVGFFAVQILGDSLGTIVENQGHAASKQAATATTRHIELKTNTLRRDAGLITAEFDMLAPFLDDAVITTNQITPEQLYDRFGPQIFTTLSRQGRDELTIDFIQIRSADGTLLLDLWINPLMRGSINDNLLSTASSATASETHDVGSIVLSKGGATAYMVGAASISFAATPRGGSVLTLGVRIGEDLLESVGLDEGQEAAVVGPHGIIAAVGSSSDDPQWQAMMEAAAKKAGPSKAIASGEDFFLAREAITSELSEELHVVVAHHAGPITLEIAESRQKAWLALGGGALIFTIAALLVSGALVRPLHNVTRAAQDLAAGDLTTRAPVSSEDEVGKLALAFNSMAEELSRRARTLAGAFDEMKSLSETDALTGLLNHRAIHGALTAELERAERYGLMVGIVVIDIDHFKAINDTYGHPTGDLVLCQVADVLRNHTRSSDIVGRHGGDEFMAILPETDAKQATSLADKLRHEMYDHPLEIDGLKIPIRLSLGTASFPADYKQMSDLLGRADANMYASKRRGGDTVTRGGESASAAPPDAAFDVLSSLVSAIENKDSYTRQHSDDVTVAAQLIADQIGCDVADQKSIRVAALLHDVGKIGVPDTILRKPGRLTGAELDVIKQHPSLGAVLIASILGEDAICVAVASHHEHWDGEGYPAGLKGEAIPLWSRIIAVADAYAAMTGDRPYRQALSSEEALENVRAGAGTHFDPDLAHALCLAVTTGERARDEDGTGVGNLTGEHAV